MDSSPPTSPGSSLSDSNVVPSIFKRPPYCTSHDPLSLLHGNRAAPRSEITINVPDYNAALDFDLKSRPDVMARMMEVARERMPSGFWDAMNDDGSGDDDDDDETGKKGQDTHVSDSFVECLDRLKLGADHAAVLARGGKDENGGCDDNDDDEEEEEEKEEEEESGSNDGKDTDVKTKLRSSGTVAGKSNDKEELGRGIYDRSVLMTEVEAMSDIATNSLVLTPAATTLNDVGNGLTSGLKNVTEKKDGQETYALEGENGHVNEELSVNHTKLNTDIENCETLPEVASENGVMTLDGTNENSNEDKSHINGKMDKDIYGRAISGTKKKGQSDVSTSRAGLVSTNNANQSQETPQLALETPLADLGSTEPRNIDLIPESGNPQKSFGAEYRTAATVEEKLDENSSSSSNINIENERNKDTEEDEHSDVEAMSKPSYEDQDLARRLGWVVVEDREWMVPVLTGKLEQMGLREH